MNKLLLLFTLLAMALSPIEASAAKPQYTASDSVKVEKLIRDAQNQPESTNLMVYVARRLKGIPYVAKTLENNEKETLVVNLRQLDCTTYVETVLAIVRCARQGRLRFADFCNQLRDIRYRNGEVDYASRLHYFSLWIDDNTRMGYVEEVSEPNPPFSAKQRLVIDYMTKHTDQYPMMKGRPATIAKIARMEKSMEGREVAYIPKDSIANTPLMRQTIHDGDIIAIVTKKQGLDTSHIGIAVWHNDGLHMLNASLVHKKVVEERRTLFDYMQRNRSQIGIRIIRPH